MSRHGPVMSQKLLGDTTPMAQIRAILRTDLGLSEAHMASLSDEDAKLQFQMHVMDRDRAMAARANLPNWIAKGIVTREQAASMTDAQISELQTQLTALSLYASSSDRAVEREERSAPPIERITRNEVLALATELLTVLAAQQAEIHALREELATVRASHVAVFGEQKVIEQLTRVDRDFEGFEAQLEISEEASSSVEVSRDERGSSVAMSADAADTSAAIQGLASYIAGLDVGRAVDRRRVDRAVQRLQETAKQRMSAKVRGRVSLKIGKVTGGRKSG
jgi:hypothetical protein